MRRPIELKVKGGEDERARSRLLAYFEDHPDRVFYSRQLEVLFEDELFHWVTNRAVHRLIQEGRILSETRKLTIGSSVKLLWHRGFRFYKRAATEVFDVVNRYSIAATEGALGLQGESMVLGAFARRRFLLDRESTNSYNGVTWGRAITTLILFSSATAAAASNSPRRGWRGQDARRMIVRRAVQAGIITSIGCHTFRATGITVYLLNGGLLEYAQQMAAHESARTTKLYDRRNDQITLDQVERIVL
jgi:hypothetical protein